MNDGRGTRFIGQVPEGPCPPSRWGDVCEMRVLVTSMSRGSLGPAGRAGKGVCLAQLRPSAFHAGAEQNRPERIPWKRMVWYDIHSHRVS